MNPANTEWIMNRPNHNAKVNWAHPKREEHEQLLN